MDRCIGKAIKKVREREIATQSLITGCWLWGVYAEGPSKHKIVSGRVFLSCLCLLHILRDLQWDTWACCTPDTCAADLAQVLFIIPKRCHTQQWKGRRGKENLHVNHYFAVKETNKLRWNKRCLLGFLRNEKKSCNSICISIRQFGGWQVLSPQNVNH